MLERTLAFATSAMVFAICSTALAQEMAQGLYDHHVHVLSPRLIADWKSLGMEFSRSDEY